MALLYKMGGGGGGEYCFWSVCVHVCLNLCVCNKLNCLPILLIKWTLSFFIKKMFTLPEWEPSGSVVECLTLDSGFEPHQPLCVVSFSKNINPCLVLVQPRKTRPYITERLLMGRKESNQANKRCLKSFG